uniref:NADH dehydrogenase subunit 2 n=1 Tax=Scaphidium formosanum TaxID=2828454 RepID=UPI001BEF1925|nr:NADH dehydrogenase subunit 2 [Scaphidium formosanum]QTZ18645.1 NADH dehydrogenase subunit 2 [Scaphidium formosanum]
MLNLFKLLFLSSVIIGSMISISSNSWMGMWLGLEINLLSIIPLMNTSSNPLSSEASMKYFITQAIASTLIILAIILMSLDFLSTLFKESPLMYVFNSGLMTKMGAAPFHFWFPEVLEGLAWMNCLIFLTWQKLAPMILIFYNINNFYFSFIIISCLMISGIIGFNQISMRKILAYSSINHIGWMLGAMFFQESIWLLYFSIYSALSILLTLYLNFFNIFMLKQLFSNLNKNLTLKMFFLFNFFSLAGMPPFIGFLPKWLTINALIQEKFYLLTFIMLISTLITIFYYIRITIPSLTMNYSQINYFKKFSIKQIWFNIFNFTNLSSLILCTALFNFL